MKKNVLKKNSLFLGLIVIGLFIALFGSSIGLGSIYMEPTANLSFPSCSYEFTQLSSTSLKYSDAINCDIKSYSEFQAGIPYIGLYKFDESKNDYVFLQKYTPNFYCNSSFCVSTRTSDPTQHEKISSDPLFSSEQTIREDSSKIGAGRYAVGTLSHNIFRHELLSGGGRESYNSASPCYNTKLFECTAILVDNKAILQDSIKVLKEFETLNEISFAEIEAVQNSNITNPNQGTALAPLDEIIIKPASQVIQLINSSAGINPQQITSNVSLALIPVGFGVLGLVFAFVLKKRGRK